MKRGGLILLLMLAGPQAMQFAQATKGFLLSLAQPIKGFPISLAQPIKGFPISLAQPTKGFPISLAQPNNGFPISFAQANKGFLISFAHAAPLWFTFRSPDGSFRIDFPAAPKRSQGLTRTPLGNVDTSIYSCTEKGRTFAVTCSGELPGAATKFSSSEMIENAKNKLVTEAGAREVSWNGLELSYRYAKCQGLAKIFLVENRLFVLDAKSAPGQAGADWARPFFSSFSLLPEKN